jgi:hypothetical protein
MTDTSYLGSEVMDAEGPFEPRMYRITCECQRCGREFSWTAKTPGGKDRPCPRKACKTMARKEQVQREAENLAKIILEQRAPGHIGDKVIVKAIDQTAEVVMKDYGMTDLKDNIRAGESMAPKLPPAQQQAADNMFSPRKAMEGRGGMNSRQAELLGRRAIAGAYRGMALNPASVVPGKAGEPALHMVRKERLRES